MHNTRNICMHSLAITNNIERDTRNLTLRTLIRSKVNIHRQGRSMIQSLIALKILVQVHFPKLHMIQEKGKNTIIYNPPALALCSHFLSNLSCSVELFGADSAHKKIYPAFKPHD